MGHETLRPRYNRNWEDKVSWESAVRWLLGQHTRHFLSSPKVEVRSRAYSALYANAANRSALGRSFLEMKYSS